MPIASFSLGELLSIAGAEAGIAAEIEKGGGRAILSNGWQSWSECREIVGGERIKGARIARKLDIFVMRPGRREARGEVLSHFFTYFRQGDAYLCLVSRSETGAPLSFRVNRKSGSVLVEAYAAGKRWAEGEEIGELAVFARRGPFAVKDAFKALFAEAGRMDRLAFLGAVGEPWLAPGGYESWYGHYTDIDEALILANLESIGSNGNLINRYFIQRGKPTVFQIDDGWERHPGDWRVDASRFPRGMAALAAAIEDKGLIPGLWIAPFIAVKGDPVLEEHPGWILKDYAGERVIAGWNPAWKYDFWVLDLSLPEVRSYILDLVRRVVMEWGFRYVKLDYLYAGALPGAHAGRVAPWECYRSILEEMTAYARAPNGKPVAFLGCGAPLELSWKSLPLMRVGADTKEAWDDPLTRFLRHQGRPSAYESMIDTIGRQFLDRSAFVSDPDVVFCRVKNIKLTESEKELVAAVDSLLASQIMFSDDATGFCGEGEAAFTEKAIALLDARAGEDFAATRLARDVFRLESRSGAVKGIANLSDLPFPLAAAGFEVSGTAIADGRDGGAYGPRTISLFRS